MTGDIYITANPKNSRQWRLKKTGYPKDEILHVGTKFQCQQAKIKYHEKVLKARQKKNT